MKDKFIIFVILLLLNCCSQPSKSIDRVITAQEIGGEFIRGSFYKNKWVIFNYWASWCVPCLKEIPSINTFYYKFKDKGVRVIGIALDPQDAQNMLKIKKHLHIDYPVVTKNILQRLNISPDYLPLSIIFNPKGVLVATVTGQLTQSKLIKIITIKDSLNGRNHV